MSINRNLIYNKTCLNDGGMITYILLSELRNLENNHIFRDYYESKISSF